MTVRQANDSICQNNSPCMQCDNQPLHFLIVDDDHFIRDILQLCFSDCANITLACDGKEALQEIGSREFDVIISDVNMPVMNGIDFFKNLCESCPEIGSKFIFCTGNNTWELQDLCSKFQIRSCNKPIDIKEIKTIVSEIVT